MTTPEPPDILSQVKKTWGVPLREHYAAGVTLPPPLSAMVSYIKQYVMQNEASGAQTLFGSDVSAMPEDPSLRIRLECGEMVPRSTDVHVVCKSLLTYFASLPEPVVSAPAAALLAEAVSMEDVEYRFMSVRHICQSSLHYNHRVVLQLIVNLLTRLQQAYWPVTGALALLGVALFPPKFERSVAVMEMLVSGDSFPTSNVVIQYMVEKGSGVMMTKSAEPVYLMQHILHCSMQETRSVAACMGLLPLWTRSNAEFVEELQQQHRLFCQGQVQPEGNWRYAARMHVLALTRLWLESSPEVLNDEATWRLVRKGAHSWQQAVTDGGEPERKLRKWLKAVYNRVSVQQQALLTRLGSLSQVATNQAPPTGVAVLKMDPKLLAEQICLLDSLYFRLIPKEELFLCGELSGKTVATKAPNWWRMITSFNLLSQWTCTAILSCAGTSERSEVLVFFLKLAEHLQGTLHNYNASYAIISGLSDSNVERLKQTWSRLSTSMVELNQKLQELWSISHNFRRYREELANVGGSGPSIPYCGLLSKDLFAIGENNGKDKVESPLGGAEHVNVDRFRLLWEKMEPFLNLQGDADYKGVEPNDSLQSFLLNLGKPPIGLALMDPASYKAASNALEPKKSTDNSINN